jgi:aryl-alcohol dehydrogenase-like predicted oxidoreductase
VSALGYGVWLTGADTASVTLDPDAFVRAIDVALDVGMTWIDTAELYAEGRSEGVVGRAVSGRRNGLFIASKVAPTGAGSGLRPDEIRRAIVATLRRLGTEHVDLYQVHWHDPAVPLEDTWGGMRALVDEGLTRFVGVSNFGRGLVERCLDVGPVDSVQNQFSLLHLGDREELLDWLARRDIAYLGYGSLAFGLLSGAVTDETRFQRWDWRSGREARFERNYFEELFAPDRIGANLKFVRDLSQLATELALPVAVLALRWALQQPGVTALVMGSLNPDHIRANATAGDVELDPRTLGRIDELLDGHFAQQTAGSTRGG